MKRTASAVASSKSNGSSTKKGSRLRFVLCLDNDGFDASLDVRKIYRSLPDDKADRLGLIRVIDESGEGYLYPKKLFAIITLTPAIRRRLAR